MFDVGFWELILVMIVALVVIGPQKLAKTARVVGRMVAKFKKHLDEIKKELGID